MKIQEFCDMDKFEQIMKTGRRVQGLQPWRLEQMENTSVIAIILRNFVLN